jgi:hypothetical protein
VPPPEDKEVLCLLLGPGLGLLGSLGGRTVRRDFDEGMGGRREKVGGRRWEGGRREEGGGRREKVGGREEGGGRREEGGGRREEGGGGRGIITKFSQPSRFLTQH